MKIAILTCGRSVRETWAEADRNSYHFTIGVNYASVEFDVDYAVFIDRIILNEIKRLDRWPRVAMVTNHSQAKDTGRPLMPLNRHFTNYDHETTLGYTFPCALVFCLDLWPDSEFDVFGYDLTCDPGISPYENRNHSSTRWDVEVAQTLPIWNKGNFNRIQPNPKET